MFPKRSCSPQEIIWRSRVTPKGDGSRVGERRRVGEGVGVARTGTALAAPLLVTFAVRLSALCSCSRARALALALACCSLAGCGPTYVEAEAPVGVAAYPRVYDRGYYYYWVGDRWYVERHGAWFYYPTEPAFLYHHRQRWHAHPGHGHRHHYDGPRFAPPRRAAPAVRRMTPPARRSAPPARRAAPPAMRRR